MFWKVSMLTGDREFDYDLIHQAGPYESQPDPAGDQIHA